MFGNVRAMCIVYAYVCAGSHATGQFRAIDWLG